ncbi:DoxX family protein [Sphingobacterium suaedae]|uniref:DoxX family protein n=1 Tax=Sphingobacterium suaedae TaxID=1686402 RepID=A0ABW5KJT1_9SPHI
MKKRNKIIYWIATVWLALGMTSTGVVQLLKMPEEVESLAKLGYPVYLLTILGGWKILGTIAVLMPRCPLVKEWAYAGFFFAMTGAILSHLAMREAFSSILPSLLLLVLTALSWYFRPASRTLRQKDRVVFT